MAPRTSRFSICATNCSEVTAYTSGSPAATDSRSQVAGGAGASSDSAAGVCGCETAPTGDSSSQRPGSAATRTAIEPPNLATPCSECGNAPAGGVAGLADSAGAMIPAICQAADSSATLTFARRMNFASRLATAAASSRGSTASTSPGAACTRRSSAITRPCAL